MRCKDVDKLLNLYIDDMLDEATRVDITSHIDSCSRCREKLQDLIDLVNLLEDLPERELPTGFSERLSRALRADDIEYRRYSKRKNIVRGAAILAATVLVAISIKTGVFNMSRRSLDSREDSDEDTRYKITQESAPRNEINTDEDIEEDGAMGMEADDEKGVEKSIDKEMDNSRVDRDDLSQAEKILTEDIVIGVEDVCANPQAVEWMAIILDIEVLDIDEDSIVVEVDDEEKRELFYDELSKLGTIENLGRDRQSKRIRISIVPK